MHVKIHNTFIALSRRSKSWSPCDRFEGACDLFLMLVRKMLTFSRFQGRVSELSLACRLLIVKDVMRIPSCSPLFTLFEVNCRLRILLRSITVLQIINY